MPVPTDRTLVTAYDTRPKKPPAGRRRVLPAWRRSRAGWVTADMRWRRPASTNRRTASRRANRKGSMEMSAFRLRFAALRC